MCEISVLVTTFNRSKYILNCLESVFSQNIDDLEIIIVDDGSTDDTREKINSLNSPRIRYLYQQNQGISHARNKCLELATGQFLAFIDSDDIWASTKLAKQLDFFKTNPSAEIVFTGYRNFINDDLKENSSNLIKKIDKEFTIEKNNKFCLPTALFKRELIKKTGGFRTDLRIGEDIEWIMRMKMTGIFIDNYIPDILYYRRLHQKNSIFIEKTPTNSLTKLIAAQMRNKIKEYKK